MGRDNGAAAVASDQKHVGPQAGRVLWSPASQTLREMKREDRCISSVSRGSPFLDLSTVWNRTSSDPSFLVGSVSALFPRYCHVRVPKGLLKDLLPGPVTLVLERSEELNKDLNPFTPVSQICSSCVPTLLPSGFH